MSRNSFIIDNPTIELFVRATTKNGKPALQVSKFITDPEHIKEIINCANNTINLNAIITIPEKIKFYGRLAEHEIIKYDMDSDEYRWII